jgi:nitroreductase
MNTFDAIRERRAVKHFDPNHQLTLEETQQLLGNPPTG